MAALCAGLGRDEESAAWLERGFRDRNEIIVWFNFDHRSERLRSSPRFREMMREVGLT